MSIQQKRIPFLVAELLIGTSRSALLVLGMPRQCSVDLRWRAIWLVVLRKCSYGSVATTLFISESSVRRYCELYLLTGAVEPTK